MEKRRLNINAILLGCILLLPPAFIAALQLWQVMLSLTPYSRMETGAVVTVTASQKEVIWKEEGREVSINGEYFDIISWKMDGDIYSFTGVFDEEETAAANLLQKSTEGNSSIIWLMAFSQCFAAVFYYRFQLLKMGKAFGIFNFYYLKIYKSIYASIAPPPPWAIT